MKYVPEYMETEKQRKHYYLMSYPQDLQSVLITRDCLTLKKLTNTAAFMENGF
jgi:hypothetical protein